MGSNEQMKLTHDDHADAEYNVKQNTETERERKRVSVVNEECTDAAYINCLMNIEKIFK